MARGLCLGGDDAYTLADKASIPLCLDEYKNKLKKGDKLILTAFGAGFTWGAMYVVWDI